MRIPERPCEAEESNRAWLPPRPAGYFSNGQWHSRQCKAHIFSSSAAEGECLRNKVIYFMGDSTIRQWYQKYTPISVFELMWRTLKLRVNRPLLGRNVFAVEGPATDADIWSPRESYDSYYNITFKFSAHGPPLQNGGAPSSMPYIADRLDRIGSNQKVYVVITIGPHLLLYHPTVYISRLKSIKDAVMRLRKRSPESLVFFKGLGVYTMDDYSGNSCCLSDWLAYRYDNIARNMMKYVPGLIYLDSWDLTASYYDYENLGLHPPNDLLHIETELFLSFICPPPNT